MKKKEVSVNGIQFEFLFDENLRMWRIIETPNLIMNIKIDVEIDLKNLNKDIDWVKIVKFIEFFHNNNSIIIEGIVDAKNVLLALFKSIYKNTYDKDFLNLIEFKLSGIDFKGNCSIVNMENHFEYDYFFFPEYTIDSYCDIGSFVWRANFRDALLLGVYCDRM